MHSVILLSLHFFLVLASVILSGGEHCRIGGTHADPGTTITISCAVNNSGSINNVLSWTINSKDLQFNHLNGFPLSLSDEVNLPGFLSTVTSFNNSLQTITATLTIPASADLDGVLVVCSDSTSMTDDCTLLIKSECEHDHLTLFQIIKTLVYLLKQIVLCSNEGRERLVRVAD